MKQIKLVLLSMMFLLALPLAFADELIFNPNLCSYNSTAFTTIAGSNPSVSNSGAGQCAYYFPGSASQVRANFDKHVNTSNAMIYMVINMSIASTGNGRIGGYHNGTYNGGSLNELNFKQGTACNLGGRVCIGASAGGVDEDKLLPATDNGFHKYNITWNGSVLKVYNIPERAGQVYHLNLTATGVMAAKKVNWFKKWDFGLAGDNPAVKFNVTYFKVYNATIGGTPLTPEGTYNFTFTASDLYDASAINDFGVTLTKGVSTYYISTKSGTTHITNGTIPMNEWNKTYTATFNASDYYSVTYSINLTNTGSLIGKPYQAILYLNASEIITGNKINIFNASVGTSFNTSNSTGWTKFYLKAGSYKIQANATNYINKSDNFTISALEIKKSTINLYNSLLKINALSAIDGSTITDFNTYLKSSIYSLSSSTTNGVIYIPLIDGDYVINFTETLQNYSRSNQSLHLVLGNFYPNITFRPYTYNSINISIFDEILGRGNNLFYGRTVYLEIISSLNSYNYSTNTSTIYLDLLSPIEYRINYYSGDYEKRDYYITITNMTHSNLELYLLSSGNSTDVTFTIEDESGNKLQDSTIYLKRYYVDTNSYRVVAMSKTNQEGNAVINVDFNDAFYQVLATYDSFLTQTTGAKIFSLTPKLIIQLVEDVFQNVDVINNVNTDLTFNNATKTFTYSFTSFDGPVEAILEVVKITPTTEVVVCSNTDTTASGSILCTITPDSDKSSYVASGSIVAGGRYTTDILTFSDWTQRVQSAFQSTGVFISLLMAGTFAGLGAFSPVMSLALFLVGMLGITFFGFSGLSWAVYLTIFILGGALIYKLRN